MIPDVTTAAHVIPILSEREPQPEPSRTKKVLSTFSRWVGVDDLSESLKLYRSGEYGQGTKHLALGAGRMALTAAAVATVGYTLQYLFIKGESNEKLLPGGDSSAVPSEGFSRGEKFTPFAKFEPNSDGLRLPDTSGKGNFTEALDKVLSGEPSAGTAGDSSGTGAKLPSCPITIVTGYNSGNVARDEMSELVIGSQKKYAQQYGYQYKAFTKNLAKNCRNAVGQIEECQPQWSKIALIRDWLKTPTMQCKGESWILWLDDDMPVTNPSYRIEDIINGLKKGSQTSVIVTRDPQNWHGLADTSINTGALLVRHDDVGRSVMDKVWELRNKLASGATLGTCRNQICLHEQAGLADLLGDPQYSSLMTTGKVSVVEPRTETVALNTLARGNQYHDIARGNMELNFHGDRLEARWRPGDFAGQCSGLPMNGYEGALDDTKSPSNIRLQCVKDLIDSSDFYYQRN